MTPDQYAKFQRIIGNLEGMAVAMNSEPTSGLIIELCVDLDQLIDEIHKEVNPHVGYCPDKKRS